MRKIIYALAVCSVLSYSACHKNICPKFGVQITKIR